MSGLTRRQMLLSLPALAMVPRGARPLGENRLVAQPFRAAQAASAPAATAIRVKTLNHFGLAVSEPRRTIEFYQGLFGMPIAMRQASTTILRVGAGPQFLAIAPVAANASPSITHYCLGVDGFNADRILAVLAQHGVAKGDAPGPMTASVSVRDGGTAELAFGDPDGIECQLQDASYCGGSGPLGNRCAGADAPPKKGLLTLRDLSHLTIFSTDAARSNKFYQDLFGLPIRSYQGPTAPTLAVGTVGFLMFTGGGGGARAGAPPAPPRPATINHGCFSMDAFKPDEVTKALESCGLKPREGATGPVGPLRHYVSMRMENRGGAPGGTPELYFTDPDGLLMQLQDTSYCGGGGFLGDACK
jgi:catechol 2,3-dioxygenase-like lactoylglutathione lyase family enzyme